MSQMIGAALVTTLERSDPRNNLATYLTDDEIMDSWPIATASFQTPWWPGSTGFVGDMATDVSALEAVEWGYFDIASGAASRYGFVGISRDQYGSALGACTLKLFRASDDTLQDTTTSDPSGNFLLNTAYYPDGHYIVSHKSGSPDVDGVTQNTLIGS